MKIHLPLIISILIFLSLLLPFIGTLPYLDGSIDLVQINDFYTGGFAQLFHNWASVHPPFKVILGSISLALFGINTFSYTLIGLTFGVLALVSIWLLVNKLFNRHAAIFAVFLLSVAPLFLANSLFALTDFMLACLILISLTLYIFEKRLLLTLALCISVMTKETVILLPGAIAVVEIFFALNSWRLKKPKPSLNQLLIKLIPVVVPILLFWLWLQYLNYNNKGVWSDWVFADSAEKGTFAVIINNLINFTFLNKYAFQNWQQLFLLNFNWIIFSISILGGTFYIWQLSKSQKAFASKLFTNGDQRVKTVAIIIIFFIAYTLTVLSFQTYTITRYGLPLIPLVLIFYAKVISFLSKSKAVYEIIAIITISLISVLSLYTSLDPVSKQLWGTSDIAGEELYSLHKSLSGNDGLVYNLQGLIVSRKRSNAAYQADKDGSKFKSQHCNWMLPDINNDKQVFKIFGLNKLQAECEVIK